MSRLASLHLSARGPGGQHAATGFCRRQPASVGAGHLGLATATGAGADRVRRDHAAVAAGRDGARPARQARRGDRRRVHQREGRRARTQGRAVGARQRRQERAGRCRLPPAGVEREGRRRVRLHPFRRQHRRQRGGQGNGRADHGHADRRQRRHRQELRHRLPHARGRSAARGHLARLDPEEQLEARQRPRRDHRLRHRPRQGDREAEQGQEPRPRDPDDHVRSHDDRSPAAAPAGQGLQAGRHRQRRRRPAARPDASRRRTPSVCCRARRW